MGAQLDNGPMEDAHFGGEPPEQQLPCHRAALLLGGGQPQQALPPGQPATAYAQCLQQLTCRWQQPDAVVWKRKKRDRQTGNAGQATFLPNTHADHHTGMCRLSHDIERKAALSCTGEKIFFKIGYIYIRCH